MKALFYVPLLAAALIGAFTLLSRIRPMRDLWPPLQALLLCGMVAMAPREDWWLLLVGWSAAAFALYLFVRVAGPFVLAVACGAAYLAVTFFPNYSLWFVVAYLFFFVVSMFAWAAAPREVGEKKLWERFWK